MSSLGLEPEAWLELACCLGKNYDGVVGSLEALALFAEYTGKRRISAKNT